MQADKRRITIDRHEWTLPGPAHHTEVEQALTDAAREANSINSRTPCCAGDVHVSARDGRIVIWFEAEKPKTATRGRPDEELTARS